MIIWREKILAFAIHFLVTLILGACAAALIFLLWFPDPLQIMIGGTELFMLVVGCDLALGPLLSLVVYNRRKSRLALMVDYSVIGIAQLAALCYGVYVVAGTRPVYVAFNADRLEVVTARDIRPDDLAAARDDRYRTLPLTGPRFISIRIPPEERQDAMFQAIGGIEEHQRPKFYAPYEAALEAIRAHAKPVATLEEKFPGEKAAVEAALHDLDLPPSQVRWLPVHHRTGFWTALIDEASGRPVSYLAFDPYGD